ncbi:hypothetical protein Glove_642g29 [Diversispora epigaea]|uniref:Uncharacterized protein n=1 Tax=Diversispora epigaea TaxID=1348612 RepID=A0A397G8H0_9GLOM|nr:hypothetical protein Glove_642g29 [Diversispora epigaea]
MDFLTIVFALLFPIYYFIYVLFNYSYFFTPLLVLLVYKFVIKEMKTTANEPLNISATPENESPGDESSDDESSGDESFDSESSEDENYDEEVYFRALVVRKYARVTYVKRR